MLALEKTLMAHIVGMLSSDTMLVTLVDDTVTPPLDVARRMNQLSQPRSVEVRIKNIIVIMYKFVIEIAVNVKYSFCIFILKVVLLVQNKCLRNKL